MKPLLNLFALLLQTTASSLRKTKATSFSPIFAYGFGAPVAMFAVRAMFAANEESVDVDADNARGSGTLLLGLVNSVSGAAVSSIMCLPLVLTVAMAYVTPLQVMTCEIFPIIVSSSSMNLDHCHTLQEF